MTIRIKMKGNDKAMVRFGNNIDREFFIHFVRMHRDDKQKHPKVSIRDVKGDEYPRLPSSMPVVPSPNAGPQMVPQGMPVVKSFKPEAMLAKGAKLGEVAGMEVETAIQNKKEQAK